MVLPDGLSPTVEAIRRGAASRQALVGRDGPLIEPVEGKDGYCSYTFVFEDSVAPSVGVYLSAPQADNAYTRPMMRLDASEDSLWVATVEAPSDLHLLYAYLPEPAPEAFTDDETTRNMEETSAAIKDMAARLVPDPLNPCSVGIHMNDVVVSTSVLRGPDAPALDALLPIGGGQAEDELMQTELPFGSEQTRRVWLSRPRDASTRAQLLVVLDGQVFAHVGLPQTLSRMQNAGEVPPTALVLVDSGGMVTRVSDLLYNDELITFLQAQVVPWAEQQCNLSPWEGDRIVAGASLGGSAACYVSTCASQAFGRAVAMSPAVYVEHAGEPAWFLKFLRSASSLPARVDVSVGIMEDLLIPDTRDLVDILRERGVEVHFEEYSGAHDVVGWLPQLATALRNRQPASAS